MVTISVVDVVEGVTLDEAFMKSSLLVLCNNVLGFQKILTHKSEEEVERMLGPVRMETSGEDAPHPESIEHRTNKGLH